MILQHPDFLRITVNPEICFGKPCIRGMRFPVSSLLDYLASGMSNEEILHDFPYIEKEDIYEALAFSSLILNDRILPLRKAFARLILI